MAFSGGVYTLPGPALNTGDTVSATENNTFRNDVATALNLTWLRNGTATATGNLPMGGYKLTGLGAGTTNGDSVRYEQLPSGSNLLPVGSGGTGVGTLTGLVKGNGTSAFSAASAGTDYQAAITATGILKGAGGGSISAATAGTDYGAPGTAATWTTPQRGTVTAANTGAFNMNTTNNFSCTPTGNISLTFSNFTAGQSGFVLLTNNSNYTISAGAGTKVATGALSTLSATGSFIISYFSDGTNAYVTNSAALS